MRVAFVGKGGSGKSLLAGTVARFLAAGGRPVLAVDSDPMPGMAFALGVPHSDAGIPEEAVDDLGEGTRPRYRLREDLSAAEAVDRYAVEGPDGIRFLQIGKTSAAGAGFQRSVVAFRQILDDLPPGGRDVVGDLPGGTRQPFFGWARYAGLLLVVVEPTPASLLTARRLSRLATGAGALAIAAVANKVARAADLERVRLRCGLEVLASVPEDPAVADAERAGAPLADAAPDSDAGAAIRSLTAALAAMPSPGGRSPHDRQEATR